MKRSVVLLACVAILAVAPARAATRDRTRPVVRYRTANNSVVVSNPTGMRSDQAPLEVMGTATDASSGVKAVVVIWFRCTTGSSSGCAVIGVQPPEPTPSVVTLSCNSTRRTCTWRATAPSVPGSYMVAAIARDKAGNESRGSGILDVLVV